MSTFGPQAINYALSLFANTASFVSKQFDTLTEENPYLRNVTSAVLPFAVGAAGFTTSHLVQSWFSKQNTSHLGIEITPDDDIQYGIILSHLKLLKSCRDFSLKENESKETLNKINEIVAITLKPSSNRHIELQKDEIPVFNDLYNVLNNKKNITTKDIHDSLVTFFNQVKNWQPFIRYLNRFVKIDPIINKLASAGITNPLNQASIAWITSQKIEELTTTFQSQVNKLKERSQESSSISRWNKKSALNLTVGVICTATCFATQYCRETSEDF